MTLKNISNIDSLQFYRWITTLKCWQRYFSDLAEQHPLLNHNPTGPSSTQIQQLLDVVIEQTRKAIQAMSLQTLLYDLTQDYVNVNHKVHLRK